MFWIIDRNNSFQILLFYRSDVAAQGNSSKKVPIESWDANWMAFGQQASSGTAQNKTFIGCLLFCRKIYARVGLAGHLSDSLPLHRLSKSFHRDLAVMNECLKLGRSFGNAGFLLLLQSSLKCEGITFL